MCFLGSADAENTQEIHLNGLCVERPTETHDPIRT
jgi:hypothetical protein